MKIKTNKGGINMFDVKTSNKLREELKTVLHDSNNALKFFESNGLFFIDNYKFQLSNYLTYLINHVESVDSEELKNTYMQFTKVNNLIDFNYLVIKEFWNGSDHDFMVLSLKQTQELINYLKEL